MARAQAPVEPGARRAPVSRPARGPAGKHHYAGLLVKIALLGLVLAIAVFGRVPADRAAAWLGLALLVVATARASSTSTLTPGTIPAKYLMPGDAVPARVPGLPGALHHQHGVHELRRRPPGQQGGRDPWRSRARRCGRCAGSTDYALAVATKGDPITGALVFLLIDPETRQTVGRHRRRPGAAAGRRRRARRLSGKVTAAPTATPSSPSAQAGGRERRHRRVQRAHRERRRSVAAGLTRAFEGSADAGLRRRLRLHQGHRDRPDVDRRRRATASSSTPRARTWPRAGRSTSGCATSPRGHRPADRRYFLPHAGLELRLRRPDRRWDLRARAAWWRSCSTTSASRGSGSTGRC